MFEPIRLLVTLDPETWGIIGRSLHFALWSSLFSLVGGLPIGAALASGNGRAVKACASFIGACTALPTVVLGLFVYALITRNGPLGYLNLLFNPGGVILGQSLLVIPVVASLTYTGLTGLDPRFYETLRTFGTHGIRKMWDILREGKGILPGAVVAAFGRVVSEVGVSMMLGGNIRHHTRTMTTAIALESSKGDFDRAVSLGVVLLIISLAVNLVLNLLSSDR